MLPVSRTLSEVFFSLQPLPVPNAEEIVELKSIYNKLYGIGLSDAEALDVGIRLLHIYYPLFRWPQELRDGNAHDSPN